jgi:hypothetical protein
VTSATVTVKDTALSTTSDSTGHYCVNGLGGGRSTLRATKSGYDAAERSVTVNGNMTADLSMHKQSSPSPAPTPSPSPNPNPTPGPNGITCDAAAYPASASCGVPSAVCNDGTLSCSGNRSGTCSSHKGVKCWLCPGKLCNGITALVPTSEPNFTPDFGGFSPVSGR